MTDVWKLSQPGYDEDRAKLGVARERGQSQPAHSPEDGQQEHDSERVSSLAEAGTLAIHSVRTSWRKEPEEVS